MTEKVAKVNGKKRSHQIEIRFSRLVIQSGSYSALTFLGNLPQTLGHSLGTAHNIHVMTTHPYMGLTYYKLNNERVTEKKTTAIQEIFEEKKIFCLTNKYKN